MLCVTTLGHRRFIDDAVQVVGLPFGSRILFRYRKRYVANDLWDAARGEIHEQWHALIALGVEVGGTARFEPLRVGRICRMCIEGEILTVDVALGGFAADGDYVWPGVFAFAKHLPTSFLEGSDRSGHYFQILGRCPPNVIVDRSVDAWERTADAFFRVDVDRKVPFLYFMQGRSGAFRRYMEVGELMVESGSRLVWDVHTRCRPLEKMVLVNPLGEILIEVSCQPLKMVTSRRIRVDSRRDVKQMQLACDAVFRTVAGHISIKLVDFQADPTKATTAADRSLVTLSRYDIPVRAGWILPTLAAFAAAGATTVAMLDKSGWEAWADIAAYGAGALVFLSLKLGFRGGNS